MKILIAYYSKTGNTERVALDLATKLGADVEKIIDKKKRSGILGYIFGGRDAMKKRLTEIEPIKNNPSDYDLVILGMPVWGWNMVPALRAYLTANQSQIKNFAFFVTSGNTEAEKLSPHFQEVMRKTSAACAGFNAAELRNVQIYENKLEDFMQQIKNLQLQ